jgi:uncharacterized protein
MGDDNWIHLEKFISPQTVLCLVDALVELIKHQKQPFSVVLHGGEPLLLGAARLDFILENLRRVLNYEYPISIQTNGVLISEEILNVCSKHYTSIAVSIDGPREVHDKFRVTHSELGTYEDVMKGIERLRQHSDSTFLNAGLLAVIDPQSDPLSVYSFFKEINAPSVDFLYRDGNHSKLPYGKNAIASIEYGEWMVKLLDIYLSDENPIPIRVLDDMLKVMLGGAVTKEGLGLTDFGIVIVDTDGTLMKNDTLKSSFNGADKFDQPRNIKEHSLIDFLRSSEFAEYKEMQRPINSKCRQCSVLNLCGGGMILHRWQNDSGFDNPSVYCADQLHLIQHMKNSLSKLTVDHARITSN